MLVVLSAKKNKHTHHNHAVPCMGYGEHVLVHEMQ